MSSSIFLDIEKGYAVWLEPTHLHFHTGGKVEIKALWGNKMQKDGAGNPENWRASVTGPAGEKIEAEITYGEGLHAQVNFQAGEEGLYHVVVENPAGEHNGVDYTQWAILLVPVGHHVHGPGVSTEKGLEIVPGEFREFHPGDTVSLQVLYNGKPLPGVEVKATSHLYEGADYPCRKNADHEGRLDFAFDSKGHWMFLVNYEGETGHYTSTFVVPGVK